MKYRMYSSMSAKIARKIKNPDMTIPEMIRPLINMQSFVNSMEFLVYFEEWLWRKAGRPALIPENPSLVKVMSKAKCSVTDASFRTPFTAFTLAMPKEEKLPGPLVTCMPAMERNRLLREFLADCGGEHVQVHMPDEMGLALSIGVMREEHGGVSASRSIVPGRLIGPIFEGREKFEEALKTFPRAMGVVPLSDEERSVQYRLFRIITGLCVYVAAFPDSLVEGVPEGLSPKELDHKKDPKKGFTLKAREGFGSGRSHGSPSEHFRAAHFRELAHERFKRDELGRVRIVPVSAAIVGRAKPYTVKGEAGEMKP